MKHPFHIAFCSDAEYAQHVGVAIYSILKNVSDARRLCFWIIDVGMSKESCNKIAAITDSSDASLSIIKVNLRDKFNLFTDRHVSPATYGRLLLPELLDDSINCCLYLDGDLVVIDDILQLYTTELIDCGLGAVDDYYIARNIELAIPDTYRYFNAGVILLNLNSWRKENYSTRVIDYASANSKNLLYWDQDAMNAVLCRHRDPLPLRWNHQIHFEDYLNHLPDGGKSSEMKEAMSNPAIVHYVGPEKPWHYLCLHPYKKLYFKYRERTPWGAIELPHPKLLPRYFSGKRIVVFGAGKAGRVTIRQYRQHGSNPEYVLDNDLSKVGTMIENLTIHSPSHLSNENPDSMVIVIASMYRDEIKEQLQCMGLQEFRHFVVRGFEPQLKTE